MKNKSLFAMVVAAYLKLTTKRKRKVSKDTARKQLEKVRSRGEKPYQLPSKIKFDVSIKKDSIQDMEVYDLNYGSKSHQIIFYFHGGGYVHRPLKYHWKFVNRLAKQSQARIIFPIYPLAPFHEYKEMYEKILALYKKIIEEIKKEEMILMGDSAGGGFALSFYEYLMEHHVTEPSKVILLSPWVDITTSNPKIKDYAKKEALVVASTAQVWAEYWVGKDDPKNYMVSPMFYEHLERLKNVAIFVGTSEILYPDICEFYQRIMHNENCRLYIAKNMNHVYPLYPIKEAKKAFKQILECIQYQTEKQETTEDSQEFIVA